MGRGASSAIEDREEGRPRPEADSSHSISGLTEQERITLDTYERSAQDWIRERSGLSPDFWAEEIAKFTGALPGDHVLDVGSGNGRDARLMTSVGYQVVGIDVSSSLLKIARENCPEATFQVASVYDIPFDEEAFDGIWVCASLLHIPKDRARAALQEIARVLRGSGQLFISVKAGEGESLEDGTLGKRFFSYYQAEELRDLIRQAGLEIDEIVERDAGGARWLCLFANKPVASGSTNTGL